MKNNNKAFTLIEIMTWTLIFAIVIIWGFQALWSAGIAKVKLIEETKIEKDAIYFSEKLFWMIKQWWTIDYEEYFNRSVVWNTQYLSWHYERETWFWNFWVNSDISSDNYWESFYYCLSWNNDNMWTWWCVSDYNKFWTLFNRDLTWSSQRYWQYSLQFIDYNSNEDNDEWDEDNLNWFRWDDDDEYLWLWPKVFDWWTNRSELYLISWDWKTRTFFRWKVLEDPDWNVPCDYTNHKTPNWNGCLWTIQFLKLQWRDYWLDHLTWTSDEWEYDWVIDTWLYDKSFDENEKLAWSWSENKRVDLFPDTINITDFEIYPYPNTNIDYAWKDYSSSSNISPYIRISFNMLPSLKKRGNIKWSTPKIKIATTINLTNEYSK